MMFKRLGILTILVVLVLVGSVPAVTARGGPPAGVSQGQALATGSITVQNDGEFEGMAFPPPYVDVEDGQTSRFVFNARKGNQQVEHPGGFDIWEATGHLFWFVDGEVIRVDIQYMLQDGEGWWQIDPEDEDLGEYYIEGLRCNYFSGNVYSHEDIGGMCFVVCDLPEPFVYVAAIDGGTMYRFDVLRGNVTIKE